jgi:SAM-dependent methyltransferase
MLHELTAEAFKEWRQNERCKKARNRALNSFAPLTLGNGLYGKTNRTLNEVNNDHGVDFWEIIRELQKFYKGNIRVRVLDEGCGNSSFTNELARKGINVTRSDLINWGHAGDFHVVSVHDLLEHFGRSTFHLVVSTRGGVDWGGNSARALANIHEILVPGGAGFITTTGDSQTLIETAQTIGIPCCRVKNGAGIAIFKPLARKFKKEEK